MFYIRLLAIYAILGHSISGVPLINLYYTDLTDLNLFEANQTQQYYCLRYIYNDHEGKSNRFVIFYCLSEPSSILSITNDIPFPKYNFSELARKNITSYDLYLWSAPIDLIERYQFYLNQLQHSTYMLSERDVFYNCTWPRFGPLCQYQFDNSYPQYSSLTELIDQIFTNHIGRADIFPCYVHLTCDRGPWPGCLDWSEICDGKVDCFNGGIDEQDCWQIEIHECGPEEYRCVNGQFIPKSFLRDSRDVFDCTDKTDEIVPIHGIDNAACRKKSASLGCDDVLCTFADELRICRDARPRLFWQTMYLAKDGQIHDECWSALKCAFNILEFPLPFCNKFCTGTNCIDIIRNTCPNMLYFPSMPVFFDDIYFAINISSMISYAVVFYPIPYLCYNGSRYDPFFANITPIIFNDAKCYLVSNVIFPHSITKFWASAYAVSFLPIYNGLKSYYPIFNYNTTICNRSNMYQCMNSSVCISIHRLLDQRHDCPYLDDENVTHIDNIINSELLKQSHLECYTPEKYLHQSNINAERCNELYLHLIRFLYKPTINSTQIRPQFSFQHLCDGFVEFYPMEINGKNETDETECDSWDCDNFHTHCNKEWNCPNGRDELNCTFAPPINCSANDRICISPQTKQFMCLSEMKINDGKIDCLGGTDESKLCPVSSPANNNESTFYCNYKNASRCVHAFMLCNNRTDCDGGDDEEFCDATYYNRLLGICNLALIDRPTDVQNFFCERPYLRRFIPYLPKNVRYLGVNNLIKYDTEETEGTQSSNSLIQRSTLQQSESRYSHGLDLRVWSNQTFTKTTLCPPSFFGSHCQYQNQRITLTLKFHAPPDSWRTLFAIIISLIDHTDHRLIHSYEQITFLGTMNCDTKFHFYLLYSTRPKDLKKNYSIQFDYYEKFSLAYRGSVLLPVRFPFLPVQRQVFIVDIPRTNDKRPICNDQCGHGKCVRYFKEGTFCLCNEGWTGKSCDLHYNCTCSSKARCLGIAANNRSICLCPLNRFGPRCLLTNSVCEVKNSSICENGGQCIPNDDYLAWNKSFICMCRPGYSGERCEFVDTKLILLLDKNLILPQTIVIHFLVDVTPTGSTRSATFRSIFLKENSIEISWSRQFDLVLVELFKNDYYLIVRRRTPANSGIILKTIEESNRCPRITELFNQTFSQWHLLRRMKYYHVPCRQQSLNLSCFYDDDHLCWCYVFRGKRLAYCFPFDHQMEYDCFGENECENGGQCFQDSKRCPQRSMCRCPSCFYGRLCQLSTRGFGLSLDAILGYHIIPNVSLTNQSSIVQFSLAFIILFMIIGLVDGIICLMTFTNKSVHQVGSGLYLVVSSVTTLLTTIMFGLKSFILIFAQMGLISNRTFLQIQCSSVDFLVQVCLSFNQWLYVCIAVERTIITMKGTSFNMKKSRRAAKFVIMIILFVIIGSFLHDPFHRHLSDEKNNDDDDDNATKRIWCIVRYTPNWQRYSSFMFTFHFHGPFLINLISSILLITHKSHQQVLLHPNRSRRDILREQYRLHNHLLVAPVVLVILGVPRLIIASISKCMKSSDDSWLFLIGYFISFLPSMLTSVLFIIPSGFYRKEFHKSLTRFCT